jgi:hypothetical protein
MNQGIPFARTIRALDRDDFRASNLGLLLAAAVLAAWIGWALAARVPQYEVSGNVHFEPDGRTGLAYFPARTARSIRAGQAAIVRAAKSSITAAVTGGAATGDGLVRVDLQLSQHTAPLEAPLAVEVEIERVSPATIALRAAGLRNP